MPMCVQFMFRGRQYKHYTSLLNIEYIMNFVSHDIFQNHKKRALFREQLTPELGGKIPHSAFRSDRLLLNRLQKEGIAVPDGIVLEQRPNQVFPYTFRQMRPTYQVKVDSGGHYITMPVVDTTYSIKQIWNKHPIAVPPFKPLLAYLAFPTTVGAGEKPQTLPFRKYSCQWDDF